MPPYTQKRGPWYDTNLHTVVKLLLRSSEECGVTPLSPLFPDPPWPRLVVHVRVSFIDQIDLVDNGFELQLLHKLLKPWYCNLVSRMFTNGPGDWGSVPGQVIPKTQKMVLDATLLYTRHYIRYVSRVKWSNSEKVVVPFPIPWCSSYWKGSLQVTLNYRRQLYEVIEDIFILVLNLNKLRVDLP